MHNLKWFKKIEPCLHKYKIKYIFNQIHNRISGIIYIMFTGNTNSIRHI